MFRTLPADEQVRRINALTDEEAEALLHDWDWNARPKQLTPPGAWQYWLILAGRGFGKTRTGAEQVRQWVKKYPYVNLIGATSDDARDIMVDGESGILAICPKDERPTYLSQKRRLEWPNGARSLIFTADEPERLRGKQHAKLWLDELAAWRYPESWDQAKFGLRLGDNPQAVITTTPKPTKVISELLKDEGTYVTTGSTYENSGNLAPTFLAAIVKKYEGTRLGRQELNAEVLSDNPGALWKRAQIDDLRVKDAPAMKRIVVAIDPAVTGNADSDETGITVNGLGSDDHGYLLADLSMRGTPDEWAKVAVNAYHDWKADRIIGETNNGGDMIETVIRMVDRNVSYKAVHASRGKITRAEPISALYEQGRCHHVGSFPVLEDQMCLVAGTMIETKRGQIPIELVTTNDEVMTREGYAPLDWAGETGQSSEFILLRYSHGCVLITACHPVFLNCRSKFVSAANVRPGHRLNVSHRWANSGHLSHGEAAGITGCQRDTSATPRASYSTEKSGKLTSGLYRRACSFIMRMRIQAITIRATSSLSHTKSTKKSTASKGSSYGIPSSGPLAGKKAGQTENRLARIAPSAAAGTKPYRSTRAITARVLAKRRLSTGAKLPVYNLKVKNTHLPEFYANGILVHNCDYDPNTSKYSPDRMDANVWAFTELMAETIPGAGWLEYYADLAAEANAPKT